MITDVKCVKCDGGLKYCGSTFEQYQPSVYTCVVCKTEYSPVTVSYIQMAIEKYKSKYEVSMLWDALEFASKRRVFEGTAKMCFNQACDALDAIALIAKHALKGRENTQCVKKN